MVSGTHPPGPSGHPVFGSYFDMQRDPLGLLLRSSREYGDMIRFRLIGPFHWYFISHPDDIDRVLRTNHANYRKGFFGWLLKIVIGETLQTSDGSETGRLRRFIAPTFREQALAAWASIIVEETARLTERWRSDAEASRQVDASADLAHLSLVIGGRMLFGADLRSIAAPVLEELDAVIEYLDFRMFHLFHPPQAVPTARNRRYRRAMRRLDHLFRRAIDAASGDRVSLRTLLSEPTGDPDGLTPEEVYRNVRGMVIATVELNAVVAAWACYLIAQHPAAAERVYAELDAVLNGRLPTFHDVPALTYTRLVIEETMRLYPPAPWFGRVANAADQLGGYRIPANSLIVVSMYVTHRHPEFWRDPEAFNPERFAPSSEADRSRHAYLPLGRGPRHCVATQLSIMQAQLVLATLLQQHRLALANGRSVEPHVAGVLRPRGALMMTTSIRRS